MMVFCKHCGKQITDDSLYCQHCGGKQDAGMPSAKESKNKQDSSSHISLSFLTYISDNQKKYLIIYVIWVLIHIICWMFGEPNTKSFNPQNCFYPFTDEYIRYCFNIKYYDGTEFLVYVFLIPLIVFFYIQYWHEPLMSKIKKWKIKMNKKE